MRDTREVLRVIDTDLNKIYSLDVYLDVQY